MSHQLSLRNNQCPPLAPYRILILFMSSILLLINCFYFHCIHSTRTWMPRDTRPVLACKHTCVHAHTNLPPPTHTQSHTHTHTRTRTHTSPPPPPPHIPTRSPPHTPTPTPPPNTHTVPHTRTPSPGASAASNSRLSNLARHRGWGFNSGC